MAENNDRYTRLSICHLFMHTPVQMVADFMPTLCYRYVQYDSWWYYTGTGNGIKTWDTRPDVFPDGLE